MVRVSLIFYSFLCSVLLTSTESFSSLLKRIQKPLQWMNMNGSDHHTKTSEDAKEVVRNYVSAFNAGDLEKLQALLHEDAEIQGVLGKGTFERIRLVWEQLIDVTACNLRFKSSLPKAIEWRHDTRSAVRLPSQHLVNNLRESRTNWSPWNFLKLKMAKLNGVGAPVMPLPRHVSWGYLREDILV
jgi:hypothetical protein